MVQMGLQDQMVQMDLRLLGHPLDLAVQSNLEVPSNRSALVARLGPLDLTDQTYHFHFLPDLLDPKVLLVPLDLAHPLDPLDLAHPLDPLDRAHPLDPLGPLVR